MTPLPLTVISGYLGAGKTTLINGLLAEPHGLRLMVMVNDFGAINIDASLIKAQDEDVIALTNGCVCCTMGADLFMAIGDALDRRPRPDHLLIEASGIADPKSIANTALAEPDLSYAGIVTLVDALNIQRLLDDRLIAPQVLRQIAVADLVIQTKSDGPVPSVLSSFAAHGLPPPLILGSDAVALLSLTPSGGALDLPDVKHPGYSAWHFNSAKTLNAKRFRKVMERRPRGLYRLKGVLRTDTGGMEVHAVGTHVDFTPIDMPPATQIVALGAENQIEPAEMKDWWFRLTGEAELPQAD